METLGLERSHKLAVTVSWKCWRQWVLSVQGWGSAFSVGRDCSLPQAECVSETSLGGPGSSVSSMAPLGDLWASCECALGGDFCWTPNGTRWPALARNWCHGFPLTSLLPSLIQSHAEGLQNPFHWCCESLSRLLSDWGEKSLLQAWFPRAPS